MQKLFQCVRLSNSSIVLQAQWSSIWLRLSIEALQDAVYGAERRHQLNPSRLEEIVRTVASIVATFKEWRRYLPREVAWEDGDPPSSILVCASMRAEYYRSVYTFLCPYIGLLIDFHSTTYSEREDPREEVLRTSIESIFWSSTAFDGLHATQEGPHELRLTQPVSIYYA